MKRSRLRQKSPIPKVNPERKARMRTDPETGERHTYGEYHEWVKTLRCAVTFKAIVDAHHLKHVKSGGRDYRNQVPPRHDLHIELHTSGPSKFERKYDVDLDAEAQKTGDLWDARIKGAPLSRWLCQCRQPQGWYFCGRCKNVIPERTDGE